MRSTLRGYLNHRCQWIFAGLAGGLVALLISARRASELSTVLEGVCVALWIVTLAYTARTRCPRCGSSWRGLVLRAFFGRGRQARVPDSCPGCGSTLEAPLP